MYIYIYVLKKTQESAPLQFELNFEMRVGRKTAPGTARMMLELTAVSHWAVRKHTRRRCWTNG